MPESIRVCPGCEFNKLSNITHPQLLVRLSLIKTMDGKAKGRGRSGVFRSAGGTRQRCKGPFAAGGYFVIGIEK